MQHSIEINSQNSDYYIKYIKQLTNGINSWIPASEFMETVPYGFSAGQFEKFSLQTELARQYVCSIPLHLTDTQEALLDSELHLP